MSLQPYLSFDGRCEEAPGFYREALGAESGQVQMPLAKIFSSPCFGMVGDRFGVSWMVYAEA
jgi:uncharacterized glyoxalase superfamily protein PhnB